MGPALRLIPSLILWLIFSPVSPSRLVLYIRPIVTLYVRSLLLIFCKDLCKIHRFEHLGQSQCVFLIQVNTYSFVGFAVVNPKLTTAILYLQFVYIGLYCIG